MGITERVYPAADNTIDLLLLEAEAPVDMSQVTRVTLRIDATVVDSDTAPTAIFWKEEERRYKGRLRLLWVLFLRLGQVGLTAGHYFDCRLTVYDPSNTNGIVWGNDLSIRVMP